MKLLTPIIAIGILCLCGCETVPTHAHNNKHPFRARVTYYRKGEDRYGRRVAMSSKMRAVEGRTVAADSSFHFGDKFKIERLKGILGTGEFEKQDVGRDVERRKASHGQDPVIDVYVATKKKYNWLLKHIEPYLSVEPL